MEITIKDQKRVEDAFDVAYNGRTIEEDVLDKNGVPTGELKPVELHTKSEWVEMKVKEFIEETVKSYEIIKSADNARKEVTDGYVSVI